MPAWPPLVPLVDAVIAIVLLEVLAIAGWRVLRGSAVGSAALLANALAGLCLLGATRAVLAGAPTWACACWLAAAGVSHGWDLGLRWQGRRKVAPARPRSNTSFLR